VVARHLELHRVATRFLEEGFQPVVVQVLGAQAGAGGLVTFHSEVEQDGLLAALLDQVGAGEVAATGEIHHGRVVLARPGDEQGIQVVGLHQGVEVGFHRIVCFLLSNGLSKRIFRLFQSNLTQRRKGRKEFNPYL
jgi:hypothetical protein